MANPTEIGRKKGYIAKDEKYFTVKYGDGRSTTRQVAKTLAEAKKQAETNAFHRKTKVLSVTLSTK